MSKERFEEKVKAEVVLENMYHFDFGQYSGVLLREELMKKVAKLRAKQIHEMKKLLASNLDLLEVKEWTLAHIDDEQHVVTYYNKNDSNEKKLNRINVLDDAMSIEYKDIIVAVDGEDWRKRQEAAENAFIKHMTGENLIRIKKGGK